MSPGKLTAILLSTIVIELLFMGMERPPKTVYGWTSAANAVVEGKRVLLLQATALLQFAGP
jgi:hypothetical protein